MSAAWQQPCGRDPARPPTRRVGALGTTPTPLAIVIAVGPDPGPDRDTTRRASGCCYPALPDMRRSVPVRRAELAGSNRAAS
jgi:hypothetical protein